MRTRIAHRKSFALTASWLALFSTAGCSLVLGIDDYPERKGSGGSGGASSSVGHGGGAVSTTTSAHGSTSQAASTSSSAGGGAESSSVTTVTSTSSNTTSNTSSTTGSSSTSSSSGIVCDPTTRWPIMDQQPVSPYTMAGLDLTSPIAADAGTPSYITYDQAVAINCAGTPIPGDSSQGSGVAWGNSEEVQFSYDGPSGRYVLVELFAPYAGKATWQSADKLHTYVAQIGAQITKDGVPFEIDWTSTPGDAGFQQSVLDAELTELYNGMVATWGVGVDPETDCVADKNCLSSPDDGTGAHNADFGVRPVRFYLTFTGTQSPQPTPSIVTGVYTFAPTSWADFINAQNWETENLATLPGAPKGFQGVEYDTNGYLYLVPNQPGTPVTRFNTSNGVLTDPNAWETYSPPAPDAGPSTTFSGGSFDGTFVYFAPNDSGIVTRYSTLDAFDLPSSWESFDTTTLVPAASQFAGAVSNLNTGALLLVPATGGVAATFNFYDGGQFTDPTQWQTFDLSSLDPRLKEFHGGAALKSMIYFAPHGPASGPFPGYALAWDSTSPLASPANGGSYQMMDLSQVDPNMANLFAYTCVVTDNVRYVYYVPGDNKTGFGGDALRYDSTLPFNQASSWKFFTLSPSSFTTGGIDGSSEHARYVYFSGSNSTIVQYDSTLDFENYKAWNTFDVSQPPFNLSNAAFYGTASDGHAMYFVPDTPVGTSFTTLVRFDGKFPALLGGAYGYGSFY